MTMELQCAQCGQRITVEDTHDRVEETEERVRFRLSASTSPPPCSACGTWAWLKVVSDDARNQGDPSDVG